MSKKWYWLPGSRGGKLEMAKTWSEVLRDKAAVWNIPTPEVTEFRNLIEAAALALEIALGEARGPVNTAKCKAAFLALVAKMQFIKGHYFLFPPLTDIDYIALGLKPKAKNYKAAPVPTGVLEGDASNPAPGQVLVIFHKFDSTLKDSPAWEWKKVLRWGFFDLGVIPSGPQALGEFRSTRKKKELFLCPPETKGKVIWFSGCYENNKGNASAWGPMFSTIVT
jgi:hypothetical protein